MNSFRSTTFCQLPTILAVVLSAVVPCGAQKLKGIDQEPLLPSHDQATIQRMMHLGAAKVRPMRGAVGTSVHSEPQALPHWNGSFKVTTGANRTATQQTYSYTMVGTNPSTGGASATTTVRTILVPLRLEFADGSVLDASTDTVAPLNTSAINNVLASPQFTPSPVYAGSVNLGNTQYADAMQRGNFWNVVSQRAPNYRFAPFTLPNTPGATYWAPGTDSQTLPFGLNNQNDVVGFYYEYGDPSGFFPQAFVWYGQTKTWQKLNVPGPPYTWYTEFWGINDKGTIVGDYQNRTGIHGVVLTAACQ